MCDQDISELRGWDGFPADVKISSGELSSRGNYVLFSSAQRYRDALLNDDQSFDPEHSKVRNMKCFIFLIGHIY